MNTQSSQNILCFQIPNSLVCLSVTPVNNSSNSTNIPNSANSANSSNLNNNVLSTQGVLLQQQLSQAVRSTGAGTGAGAGAGFGAGAGGLSGPNVTITPGL